MDQAAQSALQFLQSSQLQQAGEVQILEAIECVKMSTLTVARDQAYSLWTSADHDTWNTARVVQQRLRELALHLIETSSGENSPLHLKFILEAHLKLALSAAGDADGVERHLAQCGAWLDRILAILPPESENGRRAAELRFRVHIGSAEALFDIPTHRKLALQRASEAKALLSFVPENASDLGVFCYNCAVQEHRSRCLDAAAQWAQLSVDSFDHLRNAASTCRSLRLLCASLLDLNDTEQAKKACFLAVELEPSAASLAMLSRVYLALSDLSGLETALGRLVQSADLQVTAAVAVAKDVRAHGHFSLCGWLLQQLEERFAADSNAGAVSLERLNLEVAVQKLSGSSSSANASSSASSPLAHAEKMLQNHLAGQVRLSNAIAAETVRVCFEQGFACRPTQESVQWLNLALKLLPPALTKEDGEACAQFHRLLCTIHIQNGQHDVALVHARSAVQAAPGDAASVYQQTRCQLLLGDVPGCLTSLELLLSCNASYPQLLYNIASMALAQGCTDVLAAALEAWMKKVAGPASVESNNVVDTNAISDAPSLTTDDGDAQHQVKRMIEAARVLIRALISLQDYSALIRVVRFVATYAQQVCGGWQRMYPEEGLEGVWIAKTTFNAAVSCAQDAKKFIVASTLFDLAAALCNQYASCADLVPLAKRMVVQTYLDAGVYDPPSDTIAHLHELLDSLLVTLPPSSSTADDLLLLDFRVFLLRKDNTPAAVLARVRQICTSTSAQLVERIASCCLSRPHLIEPAMTALSRCFQLHLASRPRLAIDRCSAVLRHLLGLHLDLFGAMPTSSALLDQPLTSSSSPSPAQMFQASPSLSTMSEEAAFATLRDAVDLVKGEPQWPQLERQWLCVVCWNLGSRLWRKGRFAQAEMWCSMAIGLSKLCGTSWPIATSMKQSYQQLLTKISSAIPAQ